MVKSIIKLKLQANSTSKYIKKSWTFGFYLVLALSFSEPAILLG